MGSTFHGWRAAPGDRVQHYYVQGANYWTYALCNKQCVIEALEERGDFRQCRTCTRRKLEGIATV